MDIGLLYQEYQRFAMTQNSVSQRQRQQQQPGSSTGEDILLKSIRQVMPSLLAPSSPGSSRFSASLPLSASSEEEEEEDEEEFLPQPQPQPPPPVPRPKQRHPPAASACRKTLSEPLPLSVAFESATAASTHHHHAAATSPVIANDQQRQRQLNRQTASADAGVKAGKNGPLLVINPRDVKSVLTQVVKATMRDLLGKDQETREKCLLRQIKRTLGEFEASISAIVKGLAISRCQAPAINERAVRNNSAGVPDSLAVCDVGSGSGGFGAGVCIGAASGSCSKEEAQEMVGLGAGAASSRDSGQTIRDSCCHDDRATGSTRVGVRDSDSICGDMLPPRYRHLNSLGCPHCTTVSGGSSHRNGRQKNFNHASSSGSYGSSTGSEFCISDCEETSGQSGKVKEEFGGILSPARATATAYTDRTSRLPFPRFASDVRERPEQQPPPAPRQRRRLSCRSAYYFCTDEEDEGDGNEEVEAEEDEEEGEEEDEEEENENEDFLP